jgi:hypothetical protein
MKKEINMFKIYVTPRYAYCNLKQKYSVRSELTTTDAMTTTDDMTTLIDNSANNRGSSEGNYEY